MKQIPLSQGKFALVDDEDYEWLNQWKWFAIKCDGVFYAGRWPPRNRARTKMILMHRTIINLSDSGIHVDHKNGDGLDNRKANLRTCTNAENRRNRGVGKNNTSGYKGVTFDKRRDFWRARIVIDRKEVWLGYYGTAVLAAVAYNEAAVKYHGEFARLNVL